MRSYQERRKMKNVAIILRSRMLTYWYGKKDRLVYDQKFEKSTRKLHFT